MGGHGTGCGGNMDLKISSERSPHDPPACSSTMVLKKELAEGGAFQNGKKSNTDDPL